MAEMLALQAFGTLIAAVGYHCGDDSSTELGLILGSAALGGLLITWLLVPALYW